MKESTQDVPAKIAEHLKENTYDAVVFSQFVNEADSNFVKSLKWTKCFTSPEIDIASELQEFSNESNTFKRPTYSIFKSEKLKTFLLDKKISEVILCGLDTDACVLASAYEAFDLGYQVKVLTELSGSSAGEDFHDRVEPILKRNIEVK